MVGTGGVLDGLCHLLRGWMALNALPDRVLVKRLDGAESLRGQTGGLEQFEVFGCVDAHDPFGAESMPGALVVVGKLVHHDATVLAVAHLEHQGRDAPAGELARVLAPGLAYR